MVVQILEHLDNTLELCHYQLELQETQVVEAHLQIIKVVKMKNEKILKLTTVILFLLIIIPNEKFIFPNFLYICLQILSLFNESLFSVKNLFFITLVLFSLLLIIISNKKYNRIGYILSIIYFLPNIENTENDKIYSYFLVSLVIYLISIILYIIIQKINIQNEKK